MRVVANAAVSLDGKLDTRRREGVAISGPDDFARVDRLRAESDAVMVGVGTVIADDPSLLVDDPALVDERKGRDVPPQPTRVVADSHARTPTDARILDDQAPTRILASEAVPEDRVTALESRGVTVDVAGAERVDLDHALAALEKVGIRQLMVEGGGELLFSFFSAALIDELSVYVAPIVIGGRDAPTLADGDGFIGEFPTLTLERTERLDTGVVLHYTRP